MVVFIPGRCYEITDSFGEGQRGVCVAERCGPFGQQWGLIKLSHGAPIWKRPEDVIEVDAPVEHLAPIAARARELVMV